MKLKLASLFFLILFFILIPVVKAAEEDVDIGTFDDALADRLGIPLFAAQLLTSSMFLGWFMFPAILMAKDHVSQSLVVTFMGLPIMGFCIAMGWLPTWILLMACLIVALMFAGKARGLIGGGQ